jgi:hypothetical protein
VKNTAWSIPVLRLSQEAWGEASAKEHRQKKELALGAVIGSLTNRTVQFAFGAATAILLIVAGGSATF